eukprot:5714894-Amphidinium_carterae.1
MGLLSCFGYSPTDVLHGWRHSELGQATWEPLLDLCVSDGRAHAMLHGAGMTPQKKRSEGSGCFAFKLGTDEASPLQEEPGAACGHRTPRKSASICAADPATA